MFIMGVQFLLYLLGMRKWSSIKKSGMSVLLFGILLILGIQLSACGKKSDPSPRGSGSDARDDQGRVRAGDRSSLGLLEVVSVESNHRRVAFTFAIESELRRIEGRLGPDNVDSAADSATDGYEVFYRSFQDYSVVAAILARKGGGSSGRFFLFVESSSRRYESLIDGIAIQVSRDLAPVTGLVQFIMSERRVRLADAFALVIDQHRKEPRASFEDLERSIRRSIENGQVDDKGEPILDVEPEDAREVVDGDSGSRVIIRYNPCYASQNRNSPQCAPSGRFQSAPVSGPSTGTVLNPPRDLPVEDRPAPSLPQVNPGPVVPPQESPGGAVALTCVPQIPTPHRDGSGKEYHDWDDCLKSERWMTWGGSIKDFTSDSVSACVPRNDCEKGKAFWPCCGRDMRPRGPEGLGKCRILTPSQNPEDGQCVPQNQTDSIIHSPTPSAGAPAQGQSDVAQNRCGGVLVEEPIAAGPQPKCGAVVREEAPVSQPVYQTRGSLSVRCQDGPTGPNKVRFPNTRRVNHSIKDVEECFSTDLNHWSVPLKHEAVTYVGRLLNNKPQYSGDAKLVFEVDFSRVHSPNAAHRAVKIMSLLGGGVEVHNPYDRVDGYRIGQYRGRVSRNFSAGGDNSCPDSILLSCDVAYFPNSSNCQ